MTPDHCDLLCLDLAEAEAIRAARPELAELERPAKVGKALSDPTRLLLLDALAKGGELCVCDLSWVVERSQSLTSHHVRTLREAGLVRSRREGKTVHYALSDGTAALIELLVTPGPHAGAQS